MIQFHVEIDADLPYRVDIDGLKGAATTPSGAVCAALSVGKKIPAGMRDRREVARHLFWNYEPDRGIAMLIGVLENDKFPEERSEERPLPSIEEMSGSIPNITGGLPLKDYLDDIRGLAVREEQP